MILKTLGPQIVIVDDRPEEVQSIQKTLEGLHIGNTFFRVDSTENNFPEIPINTVEMIFLDLHYEVNYGNSFDPYRCAEWLKRIVPAGKSYILIVWSRDTDLTDDLIQVIKEEEITYPSLVETKSKSDYQTGHNEYDITSILNEVWTEYEELTDICEISGQVASIEDDSLLINCLINEEKKFFELRRFDLKPFTGFTEFKEGSFLKIRVTTNPGSRKFEFLQEQSDLSELFTRADPFEDFEGFDLLNE